MMPMMPQGPPQRPMQSNERAAYARMDNMMDGKKTQEEVNYREADDDAVCRMCKQFQPPDACMTVAGKIEQSGTCDLFQGEEEDEMTPDNETMEGMI